MPAISGGRGGSPTPIHVFDGDAMNPVVRGAEPLDSPGPGEGEVGDTAGCRDRLDLVIRLERFEAVPQPHPAAEHDRYLDEVDVVDEARRDEVARNRRPTADADVPAAS